MNEVVEIVGGRYFDSVRLMQVSSSIGAMVGVEASLVAMATALNLELLADMGFDTGSAAGAGPDDLLIALRAEDQQAAEHARDAVDRLLAAPAKPSTGALTTPPAPRTVESAGRRIGANLAVVSVPGTHAFVEAMAAIEAGMHVMVFSDNVPIEQERVLKTFAADSDRLVMGPDCGTAIVNGLGLGFSNVVEPGPVAITGASGTGIQQLCCLLDASGVGVRHALGTGSRDLSVEIAARSTLQALTALDADPEVSVIVLVSKPPGRNVAAIIEDAITRCRTPVVTALLGSERITLEGAARRAVELLEVPWVEPPMWRPPETPRRPGYLRGLFSGGTLRAETHAIAAHLLGDVEGEPDTPGHWLCDFGDDRYTKGRAHPMIDPTLRLEALEAAIADAATGIIILDVVLGHGAHPDPAFGLEPLVRRASADDIGVVVSLCGSRGDPQGRDDQAERLMGAGAEVYVSNAAAAARAASMAIGDDDG